MSMVYHVGKVPQEFLQPFNLALIALLAASWWRWRGRPRRAAVATFLALLLLIVPGMPIIADLLVAQVEGAYPTRPIAEYPSADAIVVLGGTTVPTAPPRREAEEIGGSRLLAAARLYRAGKASTVIVTGGLDYAAGNGHRRTEADDMADILAAMGIPDGAMLREDVSRNTYENALKTAELVRERPIKRILLVSSAFHLRRAVPLFEQQGFEVTAVPTSHLHYEAEWTIRRFLPNPNALRVTGTMLKELVGDLAYRVLGKSGPRG